MTSAAKHFIGGGLCLFAATIVVMRLGAQGDYCPSNCPGNAGCQSQEAGETD
jgi:hypothetical protein